MAMADGAMAAFVTHLHLICHLPSVHIMAYLAHELVVEFARRDLCRAPGRAGGPPGVVRAVGRYVAAARSAGGRRASGAAPQRTEHDRLWRARRRWASWVSRPGCPPDRPRKRGPTWCWPPWRPTAPSARCCESLLARALPALRGQGVIGSGLPGGGGLAAGWSDGRGVRAGRSGGRLCARLWSAACRRCPAAAALRIAGTPDIEAILAVNAAAFEPFWRYDDATLLNWLLTSDHATLAEVDGQAAGFALTSHNPENEYAYLIRLATLPVVSGARHREAVGGRCAGRTHASLAHPVSRSTRRVAISSRAGLYESLGFRPTGQALSVMVYPL